MWVWPLLLPILHTCASVEAGSSTSGQLTVPYTLLPSILSRIQSSSTNGFNPLHVNFVGERRNRSTFNDTPDTSGPMSQADDYDNVLPTRTFDDNPDTSRPMLQADDYALPTNQFRPFHDQFALNSALTKERSLNLKRSGRPLRKYRTLTMSGRALDSKVDKFADHPSRDDLATLDECSEFNDAGIRILGGRVAKINEFPFIVRLGYKANETETTHLDDNGIAFRCGGSIIGRRWVLSAAHCLPKNEKIKVVRVAEYQASLRETDCGNDLSGNMKCHERTTDYAVLTIIKNKAYNPTSYQHDTLLIKTVPMAFNEYVKPICLPYSDKVDDDYSSLPPNSVIAAGWGIVEIAAFASDEDKTADMLQTMETSIVPLDECRKKWDHAEAGVTICAGGKKGIDTCKGDSGGPLVTTYKYNKKTLWKLIGVTSYGSTRCGTGGSPAVFASVVGHLEWILGAIEKAKSNEDKKLILNRIGTFTLF